MTARGMILALALVLVALSTFAVTFTPEQKVPQIGKVCHEPITEC